MIQDALRHYTLQYCLLPICAILGTLNTMAADQRIRSRQPDRGTYQPPVLPEGRLQPVRIADLEGVDSERDSDDLVDAPLDEPKRNPVARRPRQQRTEFPAPVVLSEHDPSEQSSIQQASYDNYVDGGDSYDDHQHAEPRSYAEPRNAVKTCSCESCMAGRAPAPIHYQQPAFDLSCDASPRSFGGCCDGSGCDSIGCGQCGHAGSIGRKLFGTIDVLLMFRRGDRIPALATSDSLDAAGVTTFAGAESVFKDMTVGGRLTIGGWLDNYKDRSLVARGWFAGKQNFGFNGNQDSHPTLLRPFLNVTDGVTPAQDTQIVTTPDRASGELHITGDSNVYGADISVRQLWKKQYGATVDLLYGYQYMRLDESLGIASRSTSLNDDFAPVGSVLGITDAFDVQNDFHGGQVGLATNYREGCWSFSSLWKMGFGSVRRKAYLTGNTFTSIDGNNANDPNGLLVRSTNSGKSSDNTFGWTPEIDLTLGWQKYPSFDVTFGYHLMAMTDTLRLSGAIDPNLATNLASPPVGAQRPTPTFRHGTFYVQGIHFGLNYIY